MYAPSLGTQHMRSNVPLPPWLRYFPAYLRDAGYFTSNRAKTDYNAAVLPGTWDQNGAQAHWRNRKPGQPFFSVFNFDASHESSLHKRLPLETDPTKVRVPAYLPDTAEVRADLAPVLRSRERSRSPSRRSAGRTRSRRTRRRHRGFLLLRSRRRAPAQQTLPLRERHASAAGRSLSGEVPVPRPGGRWHAFDRTHQLGGFGADGAEHRRSQGPGLLPGPRLRRHGTRALTGVHPLLPRPDGRALRFLPRRDRRPLAVHPQLPAGAADDAIRHLSLEDGLDQGVGSDAPRGKAQRRSRRRSSAPSRWKSSSIARRIRTM